MASDIYSLAFHPDALRWNICLGLPANGYQADCGGRLLLDNFRIKAYWQMMTRNCESLCDLAQI